MKKLRDYQAEDVVRIFGQWSEFNSTLYVAATGLGKTHVMTEVAQRMLPGRTILLAHRSELIIQARDAFTERGMESEVEKADLVAGNGLFNSAQVVIASVQTLLSGKEEWTRMQRFDPKDFCLLLYDEAHHGVSVGNKSIVDYFTAGNPDLKVLGVSATPDRADEEALGQIFQTVASERDILWANENGWLVPIMQRMVEVDGLDFSGVKNAMGDLSTSDLAAIMKSERSLHGVVQPTLESLFDLEPQTLRDIPTSEWPDFFSERKTEHRALVFTVTVEHAEMLANIFNRVIAGRASWICGKTREDERLKILKRFKAGGDLNLLVNVGVATEGYDNPAVDMIVMARPTKSRCLYAQCLGRGTRPVPGLVDLHATPEARKDAIAKSSKPHVLVLDFVGNSGRHKLLTSADILGGKVSQDAVVRAVEKAKKKAAPVMMTEALLEAEAELRREADERRRLLEAKKKTIVAKSNYSFRNVNAFDVFALEPQRERGWDQGKTLSPKRRDVLIKQGIDPDKMPYGQAVQVLNEVFRRFNQKLCSFKQAKVLKNSGINAPQATREQASQLIGALVANKWKPISAEFVASVLTNKQQP